MATLSKEHSGDNQLFWVAENIIADDFPEVQAALRDPDGLLAIGGDLEPGRLLDAYRRGIFPWYSAGQPILWWSPNPRCVLEPDSLKISRSLRKRLRRGDYRVSFNRAYEHVIRACAGKRGVNTDTWITREMSDAYITLHRLGHGVSVECWQDDTLAGGLYGVVIGKIFFGESMFSHRTDASKVALAHLVQCLKQKQFRLIDCQIHSSHLQSLGARPMEREMFINILAHYCQQEVNHDWPSVSEINWKSDG